MTVAEVAEYAVEHALNDDWRGRGKLTIREIATRPVRVLGEVVGEAHVAYVRFEKPLAREGHEATSFVGFMLATPANGPTPPVYETWPVIGHPDLCDIKDKPVEGIVYMLSKRYCIGCRGIDTCKVTRKPRKGIVHVTYRCKCGYRDEDVLD